MKDVVLTFDNFINENVFDRGLNKAKKLLTGEVSREKALDIINGHAMKQKAYYHLKKNNPEIADKMVEFIMTHPNAKYFIWNETDGKFEESGYFSMKESLKEYN